MQTIPDGWTDDMTISMPESSTVEEITDFVISLKVQGIPYANSLQQLIEVFGIFPEDAELVLDRVAGGVARSFNPANKPDPIKDPFAFASYNRARKESAVVKAFYPNEA